MSSKTNGDLQNDRNKASFGVEKLTCLIYGDIDIVKRRRFIQELARNDEVRKKFPSLEKLDREKQYEVALQKHIYVTQRIKELDLTDPFEIGIYREMFAAHEISPIGLHTSMFLPVLRTQTTEEQKAKWLKRAENFEFIGTYAQTELGHGTFLRGLETTATYDPDTQEFIVNSPTISSIKYWPGNLGLTVNYSLVMAQLIIKGKNYGIHAFIVPIRSEYDHRPLPGIEVGDIGAKFGYETVDNGFLRMTNVRIPRDNMLMRYSKVLKDGTYLKPPNSKLLYGGMVMIRAYITLGQARALQEVSTIAVRYSAVRRQTETFPGGPEAQIIDYQTQQQKLFPVVATAYALTFTARAMMENFFRITQQIQEGNLDEVQELHCLSAGLKAFVTWVTSRYVEDCRMACGGHGYSRASGFPKIYVEVTPACTYEGENTVMALQAARYLVKSVDNVEESKELHGFVSYLSYDFGGHSKLTEELRLDDFVETFEHRAARMIQRVANRLKLLKNHGTAAHEAWNMCSVDLVKAAMAHCHAFVVRTFVQKLQSWDDEDRDVLRALRTLCHLYCINGIMENLGDFTKDGYLSTNQIEMLEGKYLETLALIRPDAVALVDAFEVPDEVLNSAIGRFDGNVYEALYKYAKESVLNKEPVHSSYHKYLRPFLKGEKIASKL